MKTQSQNKTFYQTLVLGALRIEDGQENASVKELVAYGWNRFQSEVGCWMDQREGRTAALKHWFQGLAINVPYMNHDILNIAKDGGALRADASEAEEDAYLAIYWGKLGHALQSLKLEYLND